MAFRQSGHHQVSPHQGPGAPTIKGPQRPIRRPPAALPSKALRQAAATTDTPPSLHLAQKRLMSLGGLKSMGWLSGVALSSSFHILIVLSASQVMRREPVRSNDMA